MIRHLLHQQARFLLFREVHLDLKNRLGLYMAYVFGVSWLVGIGRYWDHPNAYPWQYAGLGSVAYILVLSALLYIVVLPLRPARWSYPLVLVFVGLTALPALLYAIPVERFMELRRAQIVNAWFLGLVALWRVALYVRFLHKGAGLRKFGVFIATLLPLSAIVVALALLNLEHVVFELMAGIREGAESSNDLAYQVVITLSFGSFLALPLTLFCYIVEIVLQWRRRKLEAP